MSAVSVAVSLALISFSGFAAASDASSAEYTRLATRGNMPRLPEELHRACEQMRYDFRIEFARQRELREKIFVLLAADTVNVDEIHLLTKQLKEVVARIQHLAKPEWHREIWPLELPWGIDRRILFDESADLAERRRLRAAPLRSLTPADIQKLREPPVLRTERFDIEASYFVGESHAGIRHYLRGDVNSDPPGKVYITYKKMATALELCQLLPSLQFAVTVHYRKRPLGLDIRAEKKFYLIYGDPLPEKNNVLKLEEWLWPQYSLLSLQ